MNESVLKPGWTVKSSEKKSGGGPMEDERIVELYWARSEIAIAATAEKYGQYCGVIAGNILGSAEDTEECLNDTWLAAWNAIPPHRPKVLKSFLAKLARRTALKKHRDLHREKRGGGEVALALEELSECIPGGESVEDEMLAAELADAIKHFVAALDETERKVFLCRYWYLDKIETIARDFGFGESKVKTMLHRTRRKLGDFLKKEGF